MSLCVRQTERVVVVVPVAWVGFFRSGRRGQFFRAVFFGICSGKSIPESRGGIALLEQMKMILDVDAGDYFHFAPPDSKKFWTIDLGRLLGHDRTSISKIVLGRTEDPTHDRTCKYLACIPHTRSSLDCRRSTQHTIQQILPNTITPTLLRHTTHVSLSVSACSRRNYYTPPAHDSISVADSITAVGSTSQHSSVARHTSPFPELHSCPHTTP